MYLAITVLSNSEVLSMKQRIYVYPSVSELGLKLIAHGVIH